MKYPNFLNENDSIKLIAPSLGSSRNPYRIRLNEGIKHLSAYFKINKGKYLYQIKKGASTSAINRANEFIKAYKGKDSLIYSIAGGEIMADMLPFIDFDYISKLKPKYFVGFSDNTNLTFTLTTLCDIATIYAPHIGSFAPKKLHKQNKDLINLFSGKKLTFTNYSKYESISKIKDFNLAPLNLDSEVHYEEIHGNQACVQGRLIGGCIDVISILIGTPFDKVKDFLEKYKKDGFIWYFDSYSHTSTMFYLALNQLKQNGYFKYIKGVLVGRFNTNVELFDFTYNDALHQVFDEYNIPVIIGCDIGHVSPSFPIINGSIGKISFKDNKFKIRYILK